MKDVSDAEFHVEGLGGKSVHADLHSALENYLAQKNNAIEVAKNAMSNFSSATSPTQIKSNSPENFIA